MLLGPTAVLVMVLHFYGFGIGHWQLWLYLVLAEVATTLITFLQPKLVAPQVPHANAINSVADVVSHLLCALLLFWGLNAWLFRIPLSGVQLLWLAVVFTATMVLINHFIPDDAATEIKTRLK